MTDARLTPDPARITQSSAAMIAVPVADLCRAPDGPRDRQLLLGAPVTVLDETSGWSYLQAQADGYVGYVRSVHIGPYVPATHRVTAAATHAYARPDLKSPDQMTLSHGSLLHALSRPNGHIETGQGFVPLQHVASVEPFETDPAQIAALYLGTPYLWGGNSRWGIDCSGLIQAAFTACGIACPGDSDQQAASLGTLLTEGVPPQRNDLLFWKGHVALVTAPDMMIHANAYAMAVTYEPISDAVARIARSDGPVTAHRRP